MFQDGTSIIETTKKILGLKDKDGVKLIHCYQYEWLVKRLDEKKMEEFLKLFKKHDPKGLGVSCDKFIAIVQRVFEPRQNEAYMVSIAGIDFFNELILYNGKQLQNAKQFTGFLHDKYIRIGSNEYELKTKRNPEPRHFKNNNARVREIDIHPPNVVGKTNMDLQRLVLSNLITDSKRHKKGGIRLAYWSNSLKKIITMDQFSNTVEIYDKKCNLETRVFSKTSNKTDNAIQLKLDDIDKQLKEDTEKRKLQKGIVSKSRDFRSDFKQKNASLSKKKIYLKKGDDEIEASNILFFAFSEKEQRLGAVISDGSFSLWDARDSFHYEKNIKSKYQAIWISYIEFLQVWITCDKANNQYFWDINEGNVTDIFPLSKESKGFIAQAIEIPALKLIAIATSDKYIIVMDPYTMKTKMSVQMAKGGIKDIKFFNTYQSLLVSGYDNVIPIFKITPKHNDLNLVGKLKGHLSYVVALEVIEGTPMVISADGTPVIRTWDIRKFQCLQSIPFPNRMALNKLVTLQSVNKLAIIGTRLTVIDYLPVYDTKNERQAMNFPISAIVDKNRSLIYLATVNEIKTIEMSTGRIQKVFTNMIDPDCPDEISKFSIIENGRTLVLSNCTGSILQLRSKTGELLEKIESHKSIVTNMIYDNINNQILSASSDSIIKVQKIESNFDMDTSFENEPSKEQKVKTDLNQLRLMENCFKGNGVDFMDLSLEMNLIACSSSDELVVFIDYEYFKVVGTFGLKENADITLLKFLPKYFCLIVAENTGEVQLLHLSYKQFSWLKVCKLYSFNIQDYLSKPDNLNNIYCNIFYFDYKFTETQTKHHTTDQIIIDSKLSYMEWYLGISDGSILRFDVTEFIKEWVVSEKAYERANYNATKKFDSIDYEHSLKSMNTIPKSNDSDALLMTRFYPNFRKFDLKETEHIKAKIHNELITSIYVVRVPEPRVLTTSQDFYFKIFDKNFNQLCLTNINHPLPIKWDLNYSQEFETFEKIYRALTYLNNLLTPGIQEVVQTSFDDLMLIKSSMSSIFKELKVDRSIMEISQIKDKKDNLKSKIRPICMRDQYMAKDLAFQKIMKDDIRDITGPTLKEMDAISKAKLMKIHIISNDDEQTKTSHSNVTEVNLRDLWKPSIKNEIDKKKEKNAELKHILEKDTEIWCRQTKYFKKMLLKATNDDIKVNDSSEDEFCFEDQKNLNISKGGEDSKFTSSQRKSSNVFNKSKKNLHEKSKSQHILNLDGNFKNSHKKNALSFYEYAGSRNLVALNNMQYTTTSTSALNKKNKAINAFLGHSAHKDKISTTNRSPARSIEKGETDPFENADIKYASRKNSLKNGYLTGSQNKGKAGLASQEALAPIEVLRGSIISEKIKEENPTDTSSNKNKVFQGEKQLNKTDQKFFFKTINNNMKKRLAKVVLNHTYDVELDFLSNKNAMNTVKKRSRKASLGIRNLSYANLKDPAIALDSAQKQRNVSSSNIRIKKTNSFFDTDILNQ